MKYYLSAFQNFYKLTGRTTRKEFWIFVLIHLLVIVLSNVIDEALGLTWYDYDLGPFYLAYMFITFLPGLSISVRRLHDVNKSGWYLLLNFIPTFGTIILLIFFARGGSHGINNYGEDPYGRKSNFFKSYYSI